MPETVAMVSVHDLMPDTMPVVQQLVDRLDEDGVSPLTLLVVPGYSWNAGQLEWLRERQQRGDHLAGHGWLHRASAPVGIYDRLHRRFFSRGVAEHLPLDSDGIADLIRRCHEWFPANDLEEPTLYVPPAWAMGKISRARLRELSFERYETLAGIYDVRENRFDCIPLLGYEADTTTRALLLRCSNVVNSTIARLGGRIRVALHPYDLQLELREDLQKTIGRLGVHQGDPVRYA